MRKSQWCITPWFYRGVETKRRRGLLIRFIGLWALMIGKKQVHTGGKKKI